MSADQAHTHTLEAPAPGFASSDDASRKAKENTLLSPRFYTTDFAAMDRIDVTPVRPTRRARA